MAKPVSLPKQGQSVETCIITQWYKKKGEQVNEGEVLFSYETDKAAFDEEAKTSGLLLEIFFDEGDEVPVLTNVAVIGEKGESVMEFKPGNTEESEELIKESSEPVSIVTTEDVPVKDKRIRISPRARKMAMEKGLSLEEISGSGPNGRIIVRDIEKISESKPERRPAPSVESYSTDDYTIRPVSNIRRIIAENMERSLKNSAQLTHHLGADARKILALRKKIKEGIKDGSCQDNISLNDMICFAVVSTLKKNPDMNIHFLGDQIKEFRNVHLAMAVDTERGLMVPVVRNADQFNLAGLSQKLKQLASDCRENKIDPELLGSEAATFTVSNLGAYGIEIFTPVLNLPQAGILGVNTISWRAADTGDGTIGFVPYLGLSLTYDHRAIDGAPASRFLAELKNNIENFNETI